MRTTGRDEQIELANQIAEAMNWLHPQKIPHTNGTVLYLALLEGLRKMKLDCDQETEEFIRKQSSDGN